MGCRWLQIYRLFWWLDGVVRAVKIAEAIFDYNLKQSKAKAFGKPEPKEFVATEQFGVSVD